MAQTNLLKVDRVCRTRQCWSYIGNHQGHTHCDSEVHANQTESGAGQIILQSRRKSPQTTPRSRLIHKGMQTRTGRVCDVSSTASMPADSPSYQGMGKIPKPIPASLRDAPGKTNLGKHCRERPAGKTESEMKFLIEENSKP